LQAIFPNLNLEKEKLKIIYEIIKTEIGDVWFERAIKFISTRVKDIYPTTNLAVLILDADGGIYKREQEWYFSVEGTKQRELERQKREQEAQEQLLEIRKRKDLEAKNGSKSK
jgi:hypothetical protein